MKWHKWEVILDEIEWKVRGKNCFRFTIWPKLTFRMKMRQFRWETFVVYWFSTRPKIQSRLLGGLGDPMKKSFESHHDPRIRKMFWQKYKSPINSFKFQPFSDFLVSWPRQDLLWELVLLWRKMYWKNKTNERGKKIKKIVECQFSQVCSFLAIFWSFLWQLWPTLWLTNIEIEMGWPTLLVWLHLFVFLIFIVSILITHTLSSIWGFMK